MSRAQNSENSVEILIVVGVIMTLVASLIFFSLEVWGENERDITKAAVRMLDSGEAQTQEVEFKLSDPVSISVSNTAPGKVQMSIAFGDAVECMETVVYLTLKYRGEEGAVADSVRSGVMTFEAPKSLNSSVIDSTTSLCELATKNQAPVHIDFLRS